MSALFFKSWAQAQVIVPSAMSLSATNPGGGPTTCPLAPGAYFMTDLCALVQSTLNANQPADLGSGWTVSLSTPAVDSLNATGRVTIDCTNTGAKLSRSGGTNGNNDAGASSVQTIAGDGFVEVLVGDITSTRWFGLSTSDPNVLTSTINYAIRYDVADYSVYENGVQKLFITGLTVGDKLRIQRTGTTVTFLRNGVVYYTSATPSTGALMIDTSVIFTAGPIQGIRLYDATNGYYSITWQNVTNVATTTTTWSIDMSSAGDLLPLLGYNSIPISGASPTSGVFHCDGVWLADSPLNVALDPGQMPIVSDRQSTISPRGQTLTLVGNIQYQHTALKWGAVPLNRFREAQAAIARASWERFVTVSQLGQGYTWLAPGAALQIYDHNGQQLGADGNTGSGPAYGWTIPDIDRVKATQLKAGWNGRWVIDLPTLFSQG